MSDPDFPHDVIYLEPKSCADPSTGAMWCQDDIGSDDEDGADVPWCKYIKASVADATITRLTARVEELEKALQRMLELVTHANPEAFSNGVTDSSGSIDEGDVIAGRIIDEARAAITKGENNVRT